MMRRILTLAWLVGAINGYASTRQEVDRLNRAMYTRLAHLQDVRSLHERFGGQRFRLLGPGGEYALADKLVTGMGSSIEWIELAAGRSSQIGAGDRVRYVIVVEGRVAVSSTHETDRAKLHLAPLDMLMLRPGWQLTVETQGWTNAKLLEVSIDVATDKWWRKLSQRALNKSVARFHKQRPMHDTGLLRLLPGFAKRYYESFRKILSPEQLYLMAGRSKLSPPTRYALKSPRNFLITYAGTPPGNGPALHIHRKTDEVFVVLKGRYTIQWGDSGEFRHQLGPGDIVAFPPGVNRRFFNSGSDHGVLMPLVYGTDDELEDIIFLPAIKNQLKVPRVILKVATGLIGLQFKDRAEIDFPFGTAT